MKNYFIKTLMVLLPEQSVTESIILSLPNNAIPIGIEVRPLSFPEGIFLHHLIPCDENGNPLEEDIRHTVYDVAWEKLSQLFGEHSNQYALDVMDSVLKGVKSEMLSEEEARKGTGEEG